MRNILLTGCAIAAFSAATPANATITLVRTSAIQGENVLFNNGVQTGTQVTGSTQSGTTVFIFGRTVGGAEVIRAQGGQARIEGALDTSTRQPNDTLLLNGFNLSLAGAATFNNFEFNLFGGNATSVAFMVSDNMGELFTFNADLGNGANRFGFVGIDGQTISNVAFSTVGGIADVRQIRLDETLATAVPEASTWAMMLVGFGMMGAAMRYRRRSTSTAFA
jgi:hypothetical protein